MNALTEARVEEISALQTKLNTCIDAAFGEGPNEEKDLLSELLWMVCDHLRSRLIYRSPPPDMLVIKSMRSQ